MKRTLLTLLLCAGVAVPVAALAQAAPPSPAPHMRPAPPSPTPEMRALMEKIHGEARKAAFAALTPAHASTVSSIASQVAAKTIDFPTGEKQIDALITVAEAKAVWAAAEASRREMFAAMMQSGGGPGPMMHGGPPGAGDHPPMAGGMPGRGPHPGPGGPMAWHGHGGHERGRGHHHGPSASGYLLMVSMTPEQMRALMPAPRARSSAAP